MLLRSGPVGLCSGVSMPSFPVSVWAYSRCDRFSEPLPFDTAGVDRVGRGEGSLGPNSGQVARLYAQKWKNLALPTTKEWLEKMLELSVLAKFTSLIREKAVNSFIADWKPLIDFLHEIENKDLMTCGFGE